MSSQMGLIISNLSKSYQKGSPLFQDLNLEMAPGLFGLLGPNGVGKTTLLEILSHNLSADKITVSLDGDEKIFKQSYRWKKNIGYLPQYFEFVANLTAIELLQEHIILLGLRWKDYREHALQLLERVNLIEHAKRPASTYSRGMKRRLGIVLSLVHRPRLILFDEPTAGLDPLERDAFRRLLEEYAQDRCILFSTHIVGDIARSCEQIAVMKSGRIIHQGDPTSLLDQVRNKTWALDFPTPSDIPSDIQDMIVGIEKNETSVSVYLIDDAMPVEGAVNRPARLEDAYFRLLREYESV